MGCSGNDFEEKGVGVSKWAWVVDVEVRCVYGVMDRQVVVVATDGAEAMGIVLGEMDVVGVVEVKKAAQFPVLEVSEKKAGGDERDGSQRHGEHREGTPLPPPEWMDEKKEGGCSCGGSGAQCGTMGGA
jgi:hypothetical protein